MSRFRHNPVSAGVPVVQRWKLWSTRAIGLHGVAAGGQAQSVLSRGGARHADSARLCAYANQRASELGLHMDTPND